MEPIGFAAGIIGLWSTCRDGYQLVASACTADKEYAEIRSQIIIEGAKVSSWGELWGLRGDYNVLSVELQAFLDRSVDRKVGTYTALSSLSRMFVDAQRLEKDFGIKVKSYAKGVSKEALHQILPDFATQKQDDTFPVFDRSALKEWRQRMGFFNRCQWAATSKSKAEKLSASLEKYANNLLRLCPTVHRPLVQQGVVNVVLSLDKVELESLIKAAGPNALQQRDPDNSDIYRDLTAAANLKAILEEARSEDHRPQEVPQLHANDFLQLRLRGEWMTNSEVVFDQSSGVIDYVEWNSYSTPGSAPGTEDKLKALILRLAKLLYARPRPRNLKMLSCRGIFHDVSRGRYGIVYKLPSHLRNIDGQIDEYRLGRRLPKNLNHLLSKPIMSLGYRFWLAGILVESLIAMHASGWLHKNIHPTSILFFPGAANGPNGVTHNGQTDWNRAYLMGCQHARPSQNTFHLPNGYSVATNVSVPQAYQHPTKMRNPMTPSRHAYDVYSLGLILLEIGLWKSLSTYAISSNPDIRIAGLIEVSQRLVGACGNIYTNCVRECLLIDTDDLTGERSLQTLSWTIAKNLALCRA